MRIAYIGKCRNHCLLAILNIHLLPITCGVKISPFKEEENSSSQKLVNLSKIMQFTSKGAQL